MDNVIDVNLGGMAWLVDLLGLRLLGLGGPDADLFLNLAFGSWARRG